LLDNPAVQFAKKHILEIGVPFALLSASSESPLRFQLSIANQTVPPEGWFDIASPA